MYRTVIILGCIINTSFALWSCTQDVDCSSLQGSICQSGSCVCPDGQQSALGGTICADLAPYHTSQCVEGSQCSRLFTTYECRRNEETQELGECFCQPGNHYFIGRCWPTRDFGEGCNRDEECMSKARDPYALVCSSGVCDCTTGYYTRQRGECRKISQAVGEGCVLNEDCQFQNGVCDQTSFSCYDSTVEVPEDTEVVERLVDSTNSSVLPRDLGTACSALIPCEAPYECAFGYCVCSTGYYASDDGSLCLAELGSPSEAEQCVGLLAEVIDGICSCPPNFFFGENMRDCVKVARTNQDSCTLDEQCYTFGVHSYCGAPQEPWGIRNCECDQAMAVWDENRSICRLFSGVGETCEADSDCLSGDLEILCVSSVCTCPEGYVAVDGLCLTSGLSLGDACQATLECSATANTVCSAGVCDCADGYREDDDACAPVIGGECVQLTDCVIENTICTNLTADTFTCQCSEQYVEYDDECLPAIYGDAFNASCAVTAQCHQALGEQSSCVDGVCVCEVGYHYRDEGCWPIRGLFETCSRVSECYLPGSLSDRTVCRNGLCQCDFDYPYSEELQTCTSSASMIFSNVFVLVLAAVYLSMK